MKLKDYIESRQFTQKEFAERIGISLTALRTYISGARLAPLDVAFRIEEFTNGKVAPRNLLDHWKEKNNFTKSKMFT